MDVRGVILSAGKGTRLRPLSHTGAKQLIPVANKPVLEYCIEDLRESGIHEIAIIVGHTPERIESVKNTIGDGAKWGVRITYIEQDAPRGIAHAIACAKEFVGDRCFVAYLGDNLLKGGIARFIKSFNAANIDAGLLLAEVEDPRSYGVAELDSQGNLVGIHEKPTLPPSSLVVIGVYYLSPEVFSIIEHLKPSQRGEYEISDTLQSLIKSPRHQVRTEKVDGWWDDTGSAESILRANQLLMTDLQSNFNGTAEDGTRIIGNVSIGEGTVLVRGTVIRGPVIIGGDCQIGPTYLGPYTSIGDRSIIKGGEIESSIIIGGTRIELEPEKRIVDSLIGAHSVITSASKALPSGYKLTLGEHSEVQI